MKILPHDFLRAIETQRHQRLSPTNKQTAKTATHCISSSIQELAFCPQNNLLLLLLLFASFKLWVGFFGSAENSVLTYHAHTSWRQALPQYARPVVAYFDSGLSNTTTIADSLYLLFYTACVCVFRPQEFGIRAITSSTTPHRHTLLPTVVLPIFSFFYFRGQ